VGTSQVEPSNLGSKDNNTWLSSNKDGRIINKGAWTSKCYCCGKVGHNSKGCSLNQDPNHRWYQTGKTHQEYSQDFRRKENNYPNNGGRGVERYTGERKPYSPVIPSDSSVVKKN